MFKVRMFCDWDNDPLSLIWRLRTQTRHFNHTQTERHFYKNVEFVTDDSYDFAVVFNYPVEPLRTPASQNIALLLEPPEIISTLYPGRRGIEYPQVSQIYSFCDDPDYEPAIGIGFATAPRARYIPYANKPKQLCMIVSNKVMTEYHVRRHEIKDALLASDIKMDFYGRDLRGSDPRIKGEIAPMQKHIVLNQYAFCIDFENSPFSVVTDKFYDPIICNTVPVTNTRWLADNFWSAVEYVNFDWPIDRIVDKINRISYSKNRDFHRLTDAKNAVLSGELCLARWISKRVEELVQ